MDDHKRNHNDNRSYYYSYGPFSSESNPGAHEEITPVEISPPRPLHPFSFSSAEQGSASGSWEHSSPRSRFSFKSAFIAFLAGALVVGSLMFASDRMNLFTGNDVFAESLSGNTGTPAVNAGGGNVPADLGRPNNIADMVASASPAVVKIETFVKSSQRSNTSPFFSNDDIFRYFFGDSYGTPPSSNKNSETRRTAGLGSGFIFDKSGYILTNEHVVAGADEIEVTVEGYKDNIKAKLLGTAPDLDLAVIKIEGNKDFPTLKLGNSDSMRVGDWVTAIGNPMGFDHTVSVGVVSAKEREISIPDRNMTRVYKNLLQTDASINPGNSGGPLLNLNGEVIGINTAVSSQAQGIGFAIPTSTISSVLENLKNNVKVPRPFIGISMQDIQKDWVQELGLNSTDGVLVRAVVQGSPADKSGLQPYDVITEIGGEKVKNGQQFQDKVKTLKVGDRVTLTVIRDGKALSIGITAGDQNNY